MRKLRFAFVISHPIQHFCPQYESLARIDNIEIKVFFASALGYKKYVDPGFKKEIAWEHLPIDKFDHQFLNGDAVLAADRDLDAPNLDDALRIFAPDAIIVYGYFQKVQRRAYRWARKNKVKLAYISDSELRHRRNSLKNPVKIFFLRRYFSAIDFFLSVGNANESYYRHYHVPSRKIIRMHFPIDVTYYDKCFSRRAELKHQTRNQYAIGEKDIVLSVVGKLVSWKNQGDIIEALQLLEHKEIYLHLFIIGSGDTLSDLEQKSTKLKKSVVHFSGFVNPADLPAYYASTDIYVHPAAVEPHSLAVSEAIYMGCPVIISDACGSWGDSDDVQENKNGCIFPSGKINELAHKIELLTRDAQKRRDFAEYSHKIAVEFQQRAHGDFMIDLVSSLQS